MATVTVVEGVGSHPGSPASSERGDVLFVLNDAASSRDYLSVTIDEQTNPHGEQSDKTVTSLDQGQFAIVFC